MENSLALCIPAYNASRYLPRLFDSIRQQTTPFDEIWVYDDASTDDTAMIAEQLGARVIHGHVNQGCSAGKNTLLAQIDTAWVHFHDADDTLAPEFVARAKARIAVDKFDVLLFDYEQIDSVTGKRMSRSDFIATDLLHDPVRYMLVNTVNNGGVYSVSTLRQIGGFDLDPAVRYNEDRAFHLRLAEADVRFILEPYIGSQFFFTPNSMSSANRAYCCLANHEITHRFTQCHPGLYQQEIAFLSWKNAACLASCLEWDGADACVKLACANNGKIPQEASTLFKFLCLVNPHLAIRIREILIRLIKPQHRKSYPTWLQRTKIVSLQGRDQI